MGEATLRVWDPNRQETFDLEISWSRGYDVDARVKVPARWRSEWEAATKVIQREHRDGAMVEPYPTLPIGVPSAKINKTATGIYAVAKLTWGRGVGWVSPPPYPEAPSEDRRVRQ